MRRRLKVLLDLETGVLTDVLQGTGAENLPEIANAVISEDLSKMLLACIDGTLHLANLETHTLYSIKCAVRRSCGCLQSPGEHPGLLGLRRR